MQVAIGALLQATALSATQMGKAGSFKLLMRSSWQRPECLGSELLIISHFVLGSSSSTSAFVTNIEVPSHAHCANAAWRVSACGIS